MLAIRRSAFFGGFLGVFFGGGSEIAGLQAAIGTTAVPYLDDRCPANRKGLYLAIYFMTLPFGTAVGTATSTPFWTVSRAFVSSPHPPHAPCAVIYWCPC